MDIIGIIIAIIIAITGGILGTNSTPIAPPTPPTDTVQVNTANNTPEHDTKHNLMTGAYNIKETRDNDRVTIDYNIVNSQGDTCNISTVYYNNGTAASSQQC